MGAILAVAIVAPDEIWKSVVPQLYTGPRITDQFQSILKKSGTVISAEAEAHFSQRIAGLSGADIEGVLTRARMPAAGER